MLIALLKSFVNKTIYLLCKKYSSLERNPKTLLIFRRDGMGDYILFYPFLKYIHTHFSEYKITLVVSKIALGLSPLLLEFGDIIEYDNTKFRSHNISYRYNFIKQLAMARYDVVIYPVFSREIIGNMIIELTGAQKKFYADVSVIPQDIASEIERNKYFTEHITGLKADVVFPTIDIAIFDKTEFLTLETRYLLSRKKYCVIFPGTGEEYRRWPEERFAAVCDYIVERGITPVIAGASTDKDCATKILEQSRYKENCINVTGGTTIATLANLLHAALFYFGNETGALHFAAALNTPSIAIMGGGHFGRFFPYGNLETNRIVFNPKITCKNDNWKCAEKLQKGESAPCIAAISVEAAKKEIEILLKNNQFK